MDAEFKFEGQAQLEAFLRPVVERLENPQPVLEAVGILMAQGFQGNIDAQRSPDGTPFAKTERGGTILRDSSTMYGGVTYSVDGPRTVAAGFGAVTQAYNAYQLFGSRLWHSGEIHTKGKKKGQRKGNPPRQAIGLTPETVDNMMAAVMDYTAGPG